MQPNAVAFGGSGKGLGCFASEAFGVGGMMLFAPQKGHTFGQCHELRPLGHGVVDELDGSRYIALTIFLRIDLDESDPHSYAPFIHTLSTIHPEN
jgi:hypothetical protein